MNRPRVILNMASTIDGKITTSAGEKLRFGSAEDRALMEDLRCWADGVLIGRRTLTADDPPLIIRRPEKARRRRSTKGADHPVNIVVSSSLDLAVGDSAFFQHPDTARIVLTTEEAAEAAVTAAGNYATVIRCRTSASGKVDIADALHHLLKAGIECLLLEGGGELNFSFMEAGVIDELFLTICPFVFGGNAAPTICGGKGFHRDAIRRFQLKSCRTGGAGEVFLHYERIDQQVAVLPSSMFRHGFEIAGLDAGSPAKDPLGS